MKKRDREIAWLDFARGVADPDTDLEIRQRLASGSDRDKKEVDLWRSVAALGRRDKEQAVADEFDVTRIVKAMGRMHLPVKTETGVPWIRRLVAELTFGHQPTPVGVRGATSAVHHSVFSAEDYFFDIRIESLDPTGCRLDGQVTRQDGQPLEQTVQGASTQERGNGIPVLLLNDEELLATVVCDQLGEFHSRELVQMPSKIQVLVEETLQIEIPVRA